MLSSESNSENVIVLLALSWLRCKHICIFNFILLNTFKKMTKYLQNKTLGILYHFPICIQSIITSCLDGSTRHLIKIRLEKNLPKCHFSPVALLASIM